MTHVLGHGKICYVLVPAVDVRSSADFYSKVFGWKIRDRGDGRVSFDDGVGGVSGMWMKGSPPVDASFLYIMCDSAERACGLIRQEGGEIVQLPDPSAREITALFKDPAGNIFGLYEDPGLAGRPGH
jgi:predicted enzyme related to lactoylglutathione lyase